MKMIQVVVKRITPENGRKRNLESSSYKVILFPLLICIIGKKINCHDTYVKKKRVEKGPTTDKYKGVNIGCKQNPKMINVIKCCTLEEREETKKI